MLTQNRHDDKKIQQQTKTFVNHFKIEHKKLELRERGKTTKYTNEFASKSIANFAVKSPASYQNSDYQSHSVANIKYNTSNIINNQIPIQPKTLFTKNLSLPKLKDENILPVINIVQKSIQKPFSLTHSNSKFSNIKNDIDATQRYYAKFKNQITNLSNDKFNSKSDIYTISTTTFNSSSRVDKLANKDIDENFNSTSTLNFNMLPKYNNSLQDISKLKSCQFSLSRPQLSRESLLTRRSSRRQDSIETNDFVITELNTIKSSEIENDTLRQPSNASTIRTIQERNLKPNEILKSSRSKNLYVYHFK